MRFSERLITSILVIAMSTYGIAQEEKIAPTPPGDEEALKGPKDAPPTKPSTLTELLGFPVRGSVYLKYRVRGNWDEEDHDLYEYLSLDLGDQAKDIVTGHLFVRVAEDVSGEGTTGFRSFEEITDSYDSSVTARLYYAYADMHRLGPLERGRVGRQNSYDTPLPFYFDGARADSKRYDSLLGLRGGVYGGVPVHLFESSPSGDYLVGAYAEAGPWTGSRLRVDYARVRDAYLFGTQRNDLVGLSAWQQFGRHVQAHYRHVFLDDLSLDHQGRVTLFCPDWDLQARLSYYELINTKRELAIDLDSYYFAAREYHPYWQTQLLLSKTFGPHVAVDVGADIRELNDEGDEGTFNHEFRRYFVTTSLSDWPLEKFNASFTVEVWEVPGDDAGDIRTGGLEISQGVLEPLTLTAGTSYALYKFDYFAVEERQNVRTFYAKIRYDANGLRIEPRYEYERSDYDDSDLDDVHTFWLTVRQDF